MRKFLLAFGSLILFIGVFSSSFAASDNPDEKINEFYQRVWSPYCPGNSLLECPSSQAEELREELKRRYQAGQSMTELENFLKSTYGDRVRMEPPKTFRGSLAYFIPWLAFLIVLIFLAFYWKKRIRPLKKIKTNTEAPAQQNPHQTEIEKQIEEELQERLS